MNALSLRGVRKRYGKTHALSGLDLEVPEGVICGLVGPNGAGKTTTFGIVGGLIRPDEGTVDVLGAGPFNPAVHRGRVTLLPQDCELHPATPVRKLLLFFARLQGLSAAEAQKDVDRVLEAVDLRDRADARIRQLSHGMRRRVQVAQAFLGTPRLVLLDEPASGLDPEQTARMRQLFLSARGTCTLVVSSHILSELEAVCDHVAILEGGVCLRAGSMEDITGSATEVRIRFEGTLPDGLGGTVRDGWLVLQGETVAAINAEVLPKLLDAGVGILEVRQGRSLESSYLDRTVEG